MNSHQAIQRFWEQFGLPAYPVTAVPDGAALPYLTYEGKEGFFGDGPAAVTATVWDYTAGEASLDEKAGEIAQAIGAGGVLLQVDGGAVWLRRGSPWCLRRSDQHDPKLKSRVMNVTLEFLK